jgi:hypothetical protein
MKQSQAVVLVGILILTVGGLAFVRNWIFTAPRPDTAPERQEWELAFPLTQVEDVTEFELRGKGYHDFRFSNPNDRPLELGLNGKNCKCSQVEALVLNDQEQGRIDRLATSGGAAQAAEASGGMLLSLVPGAVLEQEARRVLDPAERWTVLEDGGAKVVPVPPHAAGYVRLRWEARRLGPERLAASVWAQAPGQPKTRGSETSLQLPLVIVAPVRVHPEEIKLPDLRPNQTFDAEFLCFSSTRPGLNLVSVKEESDNPCFVCSATPLTGEALRQAAQSLERITGRVAAAYRVRVTVCERSPDGTRQLDLGPFQRRLYLTTDQDDAGTLLATVTGTVRGDVTVGTDEFQDRIVLKTFPSNRGQTATVPVETARPGIPLEIESVKPDYVQARLKPRDEGDGRRWELSVTVPPRRLQGKMPEDSAVVLRIDGQRRVRVPIIGRATLAVDAH